MTADHEAQRQATDSQTTDQEALDVMAEAIVDGTALWYSPLTPDEAARITESVLSALAEAGYTVVKTEALRELENAYVFEQVRMGAVGPWVPVPEGSAEEAGGE